MREGASGARRSQKRFQQRGDITGVKQELLFGIRRAPSRCSHRVSQLAGRRSKSRALQGNGLGGGGAGACEDMADAPPPYKIGIRGGREKGYFAEEKVRG